MPKVEILQQKGHNFLWIDDYLWMWDLPLEVEIQRNLANKAYGDVLVVGYGLGIIQQYLLNNTNVISVNTIEKYPEVISACRMKYDVTHGGIFLADFFDSKPVTEYDTIIGDIWPEIAEEHLDIYKRFKKHAQHFLKSNGQILGWGADYFEYLMEKENGN